MATLMPAVAFGGEGVFAQTVSWSEYWLLHEYSLAALGVTWFSAIAFWAWLVMLRPMVDCDVSVSSESEDVHSYVTALEKLEEQLRFHEGEFRVLVENSPDTIARYDVSGNCIYANPALVRVARESNASLIGKTPSGSGLNGVTESYDEAIREVARTAVGTEFDLSWITADETKCLTHIRLVPELNDSGSVVCVLAIGRDITARKEVEEKLQQTSESLAAIVDNIPGIVYRKIYSPKGSRMIFLSEHARRIYGEAIENLFDMTQNSRIAALWHPEDQQAVSDMIGRIAAGAHVSETKARIVIPGGAYKWMLLREVVSGLCDGNAVITGIMVDIDTQVRTEEALREASDRLDALVSNLPGVAFLKRYCEEGSKVVFVSDQAQEMFGVSIEEIYAMSVQARVSEIWHPDDAEIIRELNQSIVCGSPSWDGRVRLRRKDGGWRWVEIRERVMDVCVDGSILTGGLIIDIDAQVRTEEALREATSTMETIVQNIPGNIFRLRYNANDEKRFLFIDGAMIRQTPGVREMVSSFTPDELRKNFDTAEQKLLFEDFPKMLRSQGYAEAVSRQGFDASRPTWVRISERVVAMEGEEMITEGIAFDVTDEMEAKEALEKEEAERRRLNELLVEQRHMAAMGRLAGGIAHDFNNLLGAIHGFAGFIVEDTPDRSAAKRYANRILTASGKGQELVDEVMILTGRKRLENASFLLAEMLNGVARKLDGTVSSVVQVVDTGVVADFELEADRILLARALDNLCVNADRAMNGMGKIIIEVSPVHMSDEVVRRFSMRTGRESAWAVESWEQGDGVWAISGNLSAGKDFLSISVSDAGVGMDAGLIRDAFTPFFTTQERAVNSGLGLPIVQGIVLKHKGALVIRSVKNRGTTVEILLPHAADTGRQQRRAGKANAERLRGKL